MHIAVLLIIAYAASLVLMLGESEVGKLSFFRSTLSTSSNVWPGFLVACNLLKYRRISFSGAVGYGAIFVDCKFCFS